jgi:hypothetical protein
MAYVDLNPVRAGIAQTPEQSEHTAIKARIHELKKNPERTGADNTPRGLLPFAGNPRQDRLKGLPFHLEDYLELVDWTGRAILENKRGSIPEHQAPILQRLQIEPKHWLYMTQHFESRFKGLVGASYTLKAVCRKLEYQRTPNLGSVLQLLN